MKRFKTLVYGFLAGICISLGGTVFLSLDNKIVGSLLFTVGLFTICTQGFNLFTGKVCYVFERDKSYALDLPFIWVGNLLGCLFFAGLLLCTRVAPALTEKAAGILNRFVETLAVMIVTSCVIPLLVLLFFFWIINSI